MTITRHPSALGIAKPHIYKDGNLWVCRQYGVLRWGYGFNPSKALAEWRRMNPGGKPAAAQEAPRSTLTLMASVG